MINNDTGNKNPCYGHTKYDGSYWVNDARGIPLARVCEKCREYKLSKFRKDVRTNANYQADEQIEPDWRDDWRNSEDYDYSDVYDF